MGPVTDPGDAHSIRPAVIVDCDAPADIRARIDALESDGTLNSGQATALRAKLDQAERWEAEGRADNAARAYDRLIRQIEGWVADGVLTEAEAAELLACAEDVADGPDGLPLASISAGLRHTCAVVSDGQAYCWGFNDAGQLGNGNGGTGSAIPVPVNGELAFQSISAGGFHTCGLTVGGAAHCWGDNSSGQLGDDGLGSNSDIPVAVVGGHTFESISAGRLHTCGVTTAGPAYCWGNNSSGSLGDGNGGIDNDRDIPVRVLGVSAFESISAGDFHTCGVATLGNAYCWGFNDTGQLGKGDSGFTTGSDVPVLVAGEHSFEAIGGGNRHSCGVANGGAGFCWGENDLGQLGDGSAGMDSDTPVRVAGLLAFELVNAGSQHSCGLTLGGSAYCWGVNNNGQRGDGTALPPIDAPVPVAGELVFDSIDVGRDHTCGVTTLGEAYCWGLNVDGELGDGNAPMDSNVPVLVPIS
ncbi:MAG: RCC1 domain-containing protein [Gemmatimonadota bacterium]